MLAAALVATFGAVLLLPGCSESRVQTAEYFVFGTIVEVAIADADPDLAAQAFSLLQTQFQTAHRDWHAWEAGKLTAINEAFARGVSVQADAALVDMLRKAQDAETLSGGRFNPAIGRLIGLWGFHTSEYPIFGPPPGADEISALLSLHPSTHDIVLGDGELSSRNPAVQLDLGGIAKGYAVDQACAALKAMGISSAIVNAGGDLRAFGSKGSQAWRVAIRNPFGNVVDKSRDDILGGIEIRGDEAVFTSGNYQRFRETADHERFAHILDPHTGWPARDVVSATVIAGEGWKTDAAATALVVAGMSGWVEVAKAFGLEQVLITDDQGGIYVTPAMLERLDMEDPEGHLITVQNLND